MGSFGVQLKTLRKERNLRQKDLADILGVAQTTVANYETGIRFPDELTLHQVADYFGVSMDYLMGRTNFPAPAPQPAEVLSEQREPVPGQVSAYLKFMLNNETEKAGEFISHLQGEGVPISHIYVDILQPALYEVGRLWETGEIDVMQEHLFSEATIQLMDRLSEDLKSKPDGPGFLGFACCGEQHSIGIKMVSDLLAEKGFRTYFMGGTLPMPSVLKAVRELDIDVVGISTTMSYHINAASALITMIHNSDLFRKVKVVVGGQAYLQDEMLWASLHADGYAKDADKAVRLISSWV